MASLSSPVRRFTLASMEEWALLPATSKGASRQSKETDSPNHFINSDGPSVKRPPQVTCFSSVMGKRIFQTDSSSATLFTTRMGSDEKTFQGKISVGRLGAGFLFLVGSRYLAKQPKERIVVAIHHPLLQRNNPVVSDLNVLGANVGATSGDVTHT